MNDEELINRIRESISTNLDISRDYSDDEILAVIEKGVLEASRLTMLTIQKKNLIIKTIFNSMRRLDILQPLLDDTSISEIMVNGTESIFIERSGVITRENLNFESKDKLYNIIQSIVSKVNRTVNESSPIVDARLSDGSRVNAVLPPVAINGPILTIRKFPEKPLMIKDLINLGSVTQEAAKFLQKAVRARYNIFISGGTGSGKTTFLNALSGFIPGSERIVTIEDSAELQIIDIENIVRLETRNANVEGKGEITIRDLIKTSLRMRPDRIIVGEVRGAEAIDMLQAMNTGHEGSLSTGHANSTMDMLSRIETMVLCGADLPLDAIRRQIASAINIIVHLGRVRDMSRKVLEISEVAGYRNGEYILNPLWAFDYTSGMLEKTQNELINASKLGCISD
ncbi:MAG: CpaF family protein [Bacillota bacterium]|nr:CpaF family protein [Bacillota bacterium]